MQRKWRQTTQQIDLSTFFYNTSKSIENDFIEVSFNYNGRLYRYLKVTDPEFLQEFLGRNEGNYFLGDNVLLVVSLGENYHGAHYKLVSGVIWF